jgi:hypothetical protein
VLEAGASSLTLFGLLLGTFRRRRWYLLPFVVAGFLLQHVVHGWCPPDPVIRRLGIRTQTEIDRERCVECYNCHRLPICPNQAFEPEELAWPRALRRALSDPITVDTRTGVSGRGTAEMKTNDVTGRIRYGHVGIGVELGRPGIGTRMRDVEKVCQALAPYVALFEPRNPVTYVMTDTTTGALSAEVLDELVLSAIVEADLEIGKLEPALDALNRSMLERLQLSGRAFVSSTTLHGRFVLRACVVNPLSSERDIDAFVDDVTASAATV